MPIKPASEVDWTRLPRCPVCDTVVTPHGLGMPVAQDAAGRMYCRDHADRIEPGYPAALNEYLKWRERRAEALTALEQDAWALEQQRKTGTGDAP